MPNVSLKIKVTGLDSMEDQFASAAKGPSYKALTNFERTLGLCRKDVRLATHQETGGLRRSVSSNSHFDGEEWSGEVTAARYPGIFELARGQQPTKHRLSPTDHFFFNAVEPYIPEFAEDVNSVFNEYFNEKSPI